MSRSAINHALQQQLREHGGVLPSSDPFAILKEITPEEELPNALPINGNRRTLNMEGVLATNIVSCKYFKEELYHVTTFEEWCEEVKRKVQDLEPWQPARSVRIPSAAFCLAYFLGVLRINSRQLNRLYAASDPFLRCVAAIYLRYTLPHTDLWYWFEPLLEDETQITAFYVPQKFAAAERMVPIWKWAKGLLLESKYCGSLLPRIPQLTLENLKERIEQSEEDLERLSHNKPYGHLLGDGARVRARFSEDGEWYDAKILYAADPDEGGKGRGENKWWVVYDGFSESDAELRHLGQIEIPDAPRFTRKPAGFKDSSRRGRGGNPSYRGGYDRRGRYASRSRSRERDSYGGYRGDRFSRANPDTSRDRDDYYSPRGRSPIRSGNRYDDFDQYPSDTYRRDRGRAPYNRSRYDDYDRDRGSTYSPSRRGNRYDDFDRKLSPGRDRYSEPRGDSVPSSKSADETLASPPPANVNKEEVQKLLSKYGSGGDTHNRDSLGFIGHRHARDLENVEESYRLG